MHLVSAPVRGDDDFRMTPRQMWVAHLAACTLADAAHDDITEHGDAPVADGAEWAVFGSFPSHTWREDAQWRRRVARAFDDLASDIDAGYQPRPTCIAEQMALLLILSRARALHLDGQLDDQLTPIPKQHNDVDWESRSDHLLKDCGFVRLLDGTISQISGTRRTRDWFEPSDGMRARDPRHGFRR